MNWWMNWTGSSDESELGWGLGSAWGGEGGGGMRWQRSVLHRY